MKLITANNGLDLLNPKISGIIMGSPVMPHFYTNLIYFTNVQPICRIIGLTEMSIIGLLFRPWPYLI